jgi:ADP-ribose pyrophosphatase YjhB (NUDIX family)
MGSAVGEDEHERRQEMTDEPVPVVATLLRAPCGEVLLIRRIDTDQWELPADQLQPDETPEDAVWRPCFTRAGYRVGATGQRLMRRQRGNVDCTTYLVLVESAFAPMLDDRHDAFVWIDPKQVKQVIIAANKSGPDPTAPAPDPDQAFLDALDEPWEVRP